MTHDEARIAVGALALGALDDDEATEVRAHLATCDACQQEYDELSAMPALLGLVSADEVAAGPPVPTVAGRDRLLQQVADERKAKQRRTRASTFAGALALAASAAVIGFVVAEGSGAEVEEADLTRVAESTTTGVWAEVALNEVGWGTKIELHLTGAEVGETCRLVAVSAAGDKTAMDWTIPDSERDYISVPGAVSYFPDQIDHFDVITDDDVLLVRIPL